MVLLTMTPSIVEGLKALDQNQPDAPKSEAEQRAPAQEPDLEAPPWANPFPTPRSSTYGRGLGKKIGRNLRWRPYSAAPAFTYPHHFLNLNLFVQPNPP
ncbi:unnamed protein product [Parascedosporium putredinis]|uniref:Uncharacterized protein n=1 Tax=Parascedosporium putredinis TaxID=1442378 RepID=A0A9P1MDF4_9PEZI|nr:unnamed protein product [Parascedosporium putredinis]CAI8000371.1 unnamed protein product [Parascedosporium putredinis]